MYKQKILEISLLILGIFLVIYVGFVVLNNFKEEIVFCEEKEGFYNFRNKEINCSEYNNINETISL